MRGTMRVGVALAARPLRHRVRELARDGAAPLHAHAEVEVAATPAAGDAVRGGRADPRSGLRYGRPCDLGVERVGHLRTELPLQVEHRCEVHGFSSVWVRGFRSVDSLR